MIAISREIPVSADMQPASQAGCLFVGFDNSVIWRLCASDSAPQHEIVPGFCEFVERGCLRGCMRSRRDVVGRR